MMASAIAHRKPSSETRNIDLRQGQKNSRTLDTIALLALIS